MSSRYSLMGGGGSDQQLNREYQNHEGLIAPVAGTVSRMTKIYRPNSIFTWAFMISASVQAVTVLAIEAYIFTRFQLSLQPNLPVIPLAKAVPTYLALFIFGFLYQLVLVYDSLRLKNTIQVIGLCMYNVGLLIYASIQYDQIKKAINGLQLEIHSPPYIESDSNVWSTIQPFLIAAPCIIAVFTIALSLFAWKLYGEFAWTIYKQITADLRIKRRFLTYQIYIALLKFDFFFFLGFTVQFLLIVTGLADAEYCLTIAAIPVTVIILFMAAFWTQRENRFGMIATIFSFFCALAYFIFKLARMYQPSHRAAYEPVRKGLTSFAIITIILIVLTIINAWVCTNNFDKGLKPHLTKRNISGDEAEKRRSTTEMPNLKHGLVSSRMTID